MTAPTNHLFLSSFCFFPNGAPRRESPFGRRTSSASLPLAAASAPIAGRYPSSSLFYQFAFRREDAKSVPKRVIFCKRALPSASRHVSYLSVTLQVHEDKIVLRSIPSTVVPNTSLTCVFYWVDVREKLRYVFGLKLWIIIHHLINLTWKIYF